MFRRLVVALLLACLAVPASAQSRSTSSAKSAAKKAKAPRTLSYQELSRSLDKFLAGPALQRGFIGVHVVDLGSGKSVYETNPDRMFTPASNTKLFTVAAALATLGPDYRTETTLETNGVLEPSGRLTGDLFLVGRGDPNLSGRVLPYRLRTERTVPALRALEQMADAIVADGLREIDGDVIGDDSLFAYERYPAGWDQDDLMWGDGAPTSALTVNDNVIFLSVTPGEPGQPAKVALEPDVAYYEIDNRIATLPARSGKREIGIDRQPGSRMITLWGAISTDDAVAGYQLAIEDPAEYASAALTDMLAKRGVKVHGKARAQHRFTAELPVYALDVEAISQHPGHGGGNGADSAASARAVLARHASGKLADDYVVVNKVSQNLHAELLLRLIGKERGKASSLEAALAAQRDVLSAAGLEKDEYVLYDGSGMSGLNLISPRAVTKLLVWAEKQPWREEFRATLPVSGIDGSLEDRLRESVARGRVLAKTGTLTDANALAGYAETVSGRKLAFAVLVNHHRLTSSGAKKVIDRIVELLVDDQTGRRSVRSSDGR